MINKKRVYDAVGPADGTRLLIERLWLRRLKKLTKTRPARARATSKMQPGG
jgi:uncharacterized protein YeaO (DUF488 family)